jgi:hypothetical protein
MEGQIGNDGFLFLVEGNEREDPSIIEMLHPLMDHPRVRDVVSQEPTLLLRDLSEKLQQPSLVLWLQRSEEHLCAVLGDNGFGIILQHEALLFPWGSAESFGQ